MAAFAMCGKMTAQAGQRDALLDILSAAADLMRNVEGCQAYIVYKDADDEDAIWVTELWDSKEAHDESLKAENVRALIGQAMPLLAGSPEGATLIPVTGKGFQ
ncbi:MAG: antibiotic biosynthesis monooxygenase [Anaerolineae bacterium]|nr:antibiotic biosynthesis monooxygenase [Anaerolineae bacterium]